MNRFLTLLFMTSIALSQSCASDSETQQQGLADTGGSPDEQDQTPAESDAGKIAEAPKRVALTDTDGDGIPDCIDINANGQCDVKLDNTCASPLIDADADGVPEGLDLDCDGATDIELCPAPLIDADGISDGLDLDCDGDAEIDFPGCLPRAIDVDGDGQSDGFDVNCDGTVDVEFP